MATSMADKCADDEVEAFEEELQDTPVWVGVSKKVDVKSLRELAKPDTSEDNGKADAPSLFKKVGKLLSR